MDPSLRTRRENAVEPAGGGEDPRITAFRLDADGDGDLGLAPAYAGREWMRNTSERFANRCLPLLMANQAGWFVVNDTDVRFTWDGGSEPAATLIEYVDGPGRMRPLSHFGHGIVTWEIPFLFRTSPGWNLLVRGPANWPKEGVHALEGLVETDWAVATFTMNWILTRAESSVAFLAGEPLCMLVPQRRRDLEKFVADERPLASDPGLERAHEEWLGCRQRALINGTLASSQKRWEADYLRGTSPDGTSAADHQLRVRLPQFTRRP